ncbi:hypothetical protein VC83_08845 [Pseudogymnoascus destructans]|uniref:Uncharacterized protein n=2 Tax=Pseudogymnoascus destructans TaxID=655981 RepID=L8FPX4_PSED2|nr:uncharacterized protein VC83_08845 [Pseudogymnoascus destructans]ELR02538.1 hypothetical protein GMDG_01063 [Pseudogymnoascus destructans 20631-21]OAF54620.1 hypothetical protein VC83_08845 [Pseudogymnoascus destructans]
MSSYDNTTGYVGGGYDNPDQMNTQGWGQTDNVENTGMGPAAFPPRRGSHTFGSQGNPGMGTTRGQDRTSSYYDDDSYNAGAARGPRSASATEDSYNPGGRAGDPGYGPRRSSMGSVSSMRSFDDSQHLGEGASGRGSRGYQTGMGRNIGGEKPTSYSTSSTTGTSSKPGTGGWKGAAKRLASRLPMGKGSGD